MSEAKRDVFAKMFREGAALDLAMKRAVRVALEEHKKLRQAVAAWNGKKVVIIQPDEIPSESSTTSKKAKS